MVTVIGIVVIAVIGAIIAAVLVLKKGGKER